MPDSKAIRRKLKTAEGQLMLLAATFAGALVLAVGTLCFRSVLFEPYIRHRVAELGDDLKERGKKVASGKEPAESLKKLTATQVAGLYGGLINGTLDDDENLLADSLFKFHSPVLMDRLQITAAVGNHNQRLKAVELLKISGKDNRSRAAELCRHHFDRARRTGNTELRKHAEAVLRQFNERPFNDPEGDPDE